MTTILTDENKMTWTLASEPDFLDDGSIEDLFDVIEPCMMHDLVVIHWEQESIFVSNRKTGEVARCHCVQRLDEEQGLWTQWERSAWPVLFDDSGHIH